RRRTPRCPPLSPYTTLFRSSTFPRQLADRIEQRVGRAAARRELDPYHPGVEAAHDLGARVRRIVRVHRDVTADHVGMLPNYTSQDRKSTRLNTSHVAISYAV